MVNNNAPHKADCLIISGLFAGAFGLCLYASSAWSWIGGFSMWGIGEAMRSRRRLEYVQVFQGAGEYVRDAIGEVNEVALPVSHQIEQQKTQMVVAALKQLPMGEKMADQFIARQGLTTDWFQGIENRSSVVCGESADGKSFLLQWRVMRFLQSHPDAEIYICDPDYGSSHKGSAPNTWFGLPVGPVVQIETNDITNTIFAVADTVSDRAKRTADAAKQGKEKPTFRPLLLVVDEWVTYWGDLDDTTQKAVLLALTKICDRGIKQGEVTFILGLHDLSVDSTGLKQAFLRRLEVLLLWRASQSVRNYDNLDISGRTVEDVTRRMAQLPRVVRDRRPCVVWTDKQLQVRALPHLELEAVEFVAPDPIDPDQQWIDDTWTSEFEAQLLRRMLERQQQKKQPVAITEFWVMAGGSKKDQQLSNPRYVLFKSKVEELSGGIQDPDKTGGGRQPETEAIAEATEQSDLQPTDEILPSSQIDP